MASVEVSGLPRVLVTPVDVNTVSVAVPDPRPVVQVLGDGPRGPRGPEGPQGENIPVGGGTGDFLVKSSGTDYDTEWLPSTVIRTYQFEVSTFKKGVTAPTEVLVGSAPEIRGLRMNATNQTLAFTFMTPLDAVTADMQFMAQVFIPEGQTFTVGDRINMKATFRTNAPFGVTKVDSVGLVATTQTVSVTAPFATDENDNVIVEGGNTEFYAYMPHINLPAASFTPGQVFYGELSLNDVSTGNVPSIVVYQMHVNYFGSL